MYKVVNTKPHFVPFDVCRINKTGTLVVIREASLNLSQSADEHQWSYAVGLFDKALYERVAWYRADELTKINSIFEMIAAFSAHPFSSNSYKFTLNESRRAETPTKDGTQV